MGLEIPTTLATQHLPPRLNLTIIPFNLLHTINTITHTKAMTMTSIPITIITNLLNIIHMPIMTRVIKDLRIRTTELLLTTTTIILGLATQWEDQKKVPTTASCLRHPTQILTTTAPASTEIRSTTTQRSEKLRGFERRKCFYAKIRLTWPVIQSLN